MYVTIWNLIQSNYRRSDDIMVSINKRMSKTVLHKLTNDKLILYYQLVLFLFLILFLFYFFGPLLT